VTNPYAMVKPCGDCPFRTDKKFPLRYERREEIAGALYGGGEFHCHKTVDYSEDDDGDSEPSTGGASVCAGSLIVLERMGDPNQMMRIAQRVGMYDPAKLDMDAPVYDDLEDWVADGEQFR
jgi:hypothetical protein